MTALKGPEVDAFVRKPDARPIVLVYGPDAGLVRERVMAVLRASVDDIDDPFSLVRLEGDDLASDPARLLDEATTIPLFGGRRGVWVRAGSRNIVPAVEALLAAPLADVRVVIEAGDLKRNAALRTLCERAKNAAALPCYADSERDLARLVDEEMRAAGLTIAPDARAMLISLLGSDRLASRAELAKLVLYARGKTDVTIADIRAVIADAAALALDDVIDAAFAGLPEEVDIHYTRARAAGTAPGTIAAAALRQVSQLHLARLAVDSGTPAETVLERQMFVHFSRKALVQAALKIWTAPRLARLMLQLADAVRDTRLHAALADAIAERALLAIAQSARTRNE